MTMNPNIPKLANAFYALSALIGIPSLLGTLYFGWTVIQMKMVAPSSTSRPSTDSNVAVDVVNVITRTASAVFGFLGAIGEGVAKGLAAVSVVLLLLSLLFYFTGRGLHAQAGWARAVAMLIMIVMLLISLLFSSASGAKNPIALLLLAFSVFGVWTLWRGFA